ncbi:MAG: thioredoxin family protein [Paracoccaceae bacterium]|nr:thioredoxin family protein [Paracoccaceae bacterium]
MAAATPPVCDFGWQAPPFTLPGTDGKTYSLEDVSGSKGFLIIFICNHCPYVLAILDKIVRDARDLQALGIGVAAICSNDAERYPADSFENMARMAEEQEFPFPYLHDEDQSVARAYGAVCTPDFFGFDAKGGLQYRGRLDSSRASPVPGDLPRELYDAMRLVAETGQGPKEQVPSMGCSIKWKGSAWS